MRRFVFMVLALCFALVWAAGAADLNGTYKGKWSGQSGSGEITFVFTPQEGGAPKAEVSFTFDGENVPCKVTSFKVEGSKLTVVYQFEVAGADLESSASGEIEGKTLRGSYQTKSLDGGSSVDEGTWSATGS